MTVANDARARMTQHFLLIADDLTGACDAAVHFAMRSYRTSVLLELGPGEPDCDVLAISTDSRDFDSAEIASLWSRAAAVWRAGSEWTLIKKIDSTLRGSPGLEIETAMAAFGLSAAVITPALPAMGRVVEVGRLHLRGDAAFPAIDVVRLLCSQGLRGCVRAGPDCVGAALAAGVRAVVADAASDRELDQVVAEARRFDRPLLWAGSSGLVAALARALPARAGNAAHARPAGPVIFCIGSDHKVTVAQEAALASARSAVRISTGRECRMQGDAHLLLRVARGCDAAPVRDALAQIPEAPLLISGGDTASLVLRALGARGIDLLDEVVPGLPRGVLRGGDFDGRTVVTKSGGFGRPDALIQVADFFPCPNKQK